FLVSQSPDVAQAGTPDWSDVAWSPDGTLLAAVGFDVALYTEDFELVERIENYNERGYYSTVAAWNPQGTHFATFEADWGNRHGGLCGLALWQINPLQLIHSETFCHELTPIRKCYVMRLNHSGMQKVTNCGFLVQMTGQSITSMFLIQ